MTDEEKVDKLTRLLNGHDPSIWLMPTDMLVGDKFIVHRRDGDKSCLFLTKEAAWDFYWTGVSRR